MVKLKKYSSPVFGYLLLLLLDVRAFNSLQNKISDTVTAYILDISVIEFRLWKLYGTFENIFLNVFVVVFSSCILLLKNVVILGTSWCYFGTMFLEQVFDMLVMYSVSPSTAKQRWITFFLTNWEYIFQKQYYY